jgi:hypothetical protein
MNDLYVLCTILFTLTLNELTKGNDRVRGIVSDKLIQN